VQKNELENNSASEVVDNGDDNLLNYNHKIHMLAGRQLVWAPFLLEKT
jgi:hypothetical protein